MATFLCCFVFEVVAWSVVMVRWKSRDVEQRIRLLSFWLFRALLFIAVVYEVSTQRAPFVFINLFALAASFAPEAFEYEFKMKLPTGFSLVFLICIVSVVYAEIFLSGLLVQLFFGISLGFVGLVLSFVLFSMSLAKRGYLLMALFSFSFSVSLGALWEVVRFMLLRVFGWSFGSSDASLIILGLSLVMVGAALASAMGYAYVRFAPDASMSRFVANLRKRRPGWFESESDEELVHELLSAGESSTVEFKSSLRMNLHSKKKDVKMEYSVAKTIVAFLNSDGGTLLIGVADDGSLLGLGVDGFSSMDSFFRHFTNVVKKFVGNEFLPFIKSEVVCVDEVKILKVVCLQSDREVFLKSDDGEEFFVRNGPASIRLEGSKLVSYVSKHFADF